jgi:hypothetical protein
LTIARASIAMVKLMPEALSRRVGLKDVRLWKAIVWIELKVNSLFRAPLFQADFLMKFVTSFLTCQMCCGSNLRGWIHV